MKIDIKEYLINYIGDISWWGETNHDEKSKENMCKADEVLTLLENIREKIQDELFKHNNYNRGNGSAENLHKKAYDVLKNHCINNSYSDLCEVWEDI